MKYFIYLGFTWAKLNSGVYVLQFVNFTNMLGIEREKIKGGSMKKECQMTWESNMPDTRFLFTAFQLSSIS